VDYFLRACDVIQRGNQCMLNEHMCRDSIGKIGTNIWLDFNRPSEISRNFIIIFKDISYLLNHIQSVSLCWNTVCTIVSLPLPLFYRGRREGVPTTCVTDCRSRVQVWRYLFSCFLSSVMSNPKTALSDNRVLPKGITRQLQEPLNQILR